MLTKLKHLVNVSGISGREQAIAAKISEYMTPICDKVYTDAMGNVICRKKGRGKRVMAAAHMDVIGFLATFVDEKGFVWFDHIGGHNPSYLINTRVVFANGTRGVIRPKALDKLAEKKMSAVRFSDLYIDIGAKDQAEAKKLVKIGDTAIATVKYDSFARSSPIKLSLDQGIVKDAFSISSICSRCSLVAFSIFITISPHTSFCQIPPPP